MSLYFCSLASGSSGNSYLIKSETTALLVDCGISGKKILDRLKDKGVQAEEISGLLLTHEHIDHVRSVSVLNKKIKNMITYSNIETYLYVSDKIPEGRHFTFENGDSFVIGDILVETCSVSHDAENAVCYSFINGDSKISIVTDTGYVSDEVFQQIIDADLIALEANHDVNVLQMCRYPYSVKRRILGDRGHLSNEAAAECIACLCREFPKERVILLSHLSKENNSPEMAMISVKSYLEDEGIYLGGDLNIDVLLRDEAGKVYLV